MPSTSSTATATTRVLLRVLEAAAEAGAECLVLCDTNGGSLPFDVERIVADVVAYLSTPVGVHLHNDTDCGVANALAGVRAGAVHVQGTINGYGERVGNCNLVSIIPNLTLKMGFETLRRVASAGSRRSRITLPSWSTSRSIRNSRMWARRRSRTSGLHTSAISRRKDAYEHIDPRSSATAPASW
jgi:2-isopropylmalate synthase